MKSLLIQYFDRECKPTFDKQFQLAKTIVVIALNYGTTEKKTRPKGFYGLLSTHFSRFSTGCIGWRYKGYLLELCFAGSQGQSVGLSAVSVAVPAGLFDVFPWEEKVSFIGTSLVRTVVKQTWWFHIVEW